MTCYSPSDHALKRTVRILNLKGQLVKSIRDQCTRCHRQVFKDVVEVSR